MTKAQMFKTATIRKDLPIGYTLPDGFEAGQLVSVQHVGRAYEAMSRTEQDLYSISTTTEHGCASPILYAQAFERFVL